MDLYSLWFDADAALLLEELLWPYKAIEVERPEEPVDLHDRPVVTLDCVSGSFGRDVAPLGERALRRVRRKIGMIFRHFNPSSTERWRRTWRFH
jgi:hypothetical protein